ALDPGRVAGDDLTEVCRRPSRGLPRWADKWLVRCRSVHEVERAAARIDDARVAERLDELAADLTGLAALAPTASTRELLEHVRDHIGLGRAIAQLDASAGSAAQSHGDDLDALIQVADLHTDPAGFEPWLRELLARPSVPGGVTLSTVHRVKGREWPRVAVFGASEGLLPHRLAAGPEGLEEERRVFHVAITRGIGRVAVFGDAERPSRFLAELDRPATPDELAAARRAQARASGSAPATPTGPPRPGDRARAPAHRPLLAADEPAPAPAVEAALRAWRGARSKADAVPAYVVLADKQLAAVAARRPGDLAELARCPGIGPKRLERYGAEILAAIAEAVDGT